MIGTQLSGRYEILDRIGGGGMAIVYKALDVLLHRHVAVKVLRQQFVHDEDFIRRFRREAQAAASLSHPNVVSIYDVGQQDEIHYIIMEYVEGSTLNDKIKEEAPIAVEEAVHIATQICDALEHAHHNQIIHRDIKPHNILIGRNGRVKVTDFGIARAASSSDLTQTGAVLGSVHYFSPEQAKGVAQGEKSDLYSLGIVLYQMLTNRLPFLGESPISVALKHLQEDVEDPRLINPTIPQSVENIILKALRKDPEERYQTATQMLRDLETCLLDHRRNEPKTDFGEAEEDGEKTIVMPAIRHHQTPVQSASLSSSETTAQASAAGGESSRQTGGAAAKKARKPWVKPSIIIGVTILLLAAMWYGVVSVRNMLTVPEVKVPTVVGMTLEEAQEELAKYELKADPIEEEFSDQFEAGVVLEQSEQDIMVKEGSSIGLTVSKGEEMLTMEDYIGEKWEDVEEEIRALVENGNDQVSIEQEYSDEPPGTIIGQTPEEGEEFNPKQAEIVITVSQGLETRPMPNVIGKPLSEAQSILLQEGLDYDEDDIEYVPDFNVPKNEVIDQHPFKEGEPVEPGTKIKLFVSSGYPEGTLESEQLIEVTPEVIGESSNVRIVISDARGNDKEWANQEISSATTFRIKVLVTPEKNANIIVHLDDAVYDSWTVTYKDVEEGRANETRRKNDNGRGNGNGNNGGQDEETSEEMQSNENIVDGILDGLDGNQNDGGQD